MRTVPLLLAGQAGEGQAGGLTVTSPDDGRVVSRVAEAGPAQLAEATRAAGQAAAEMAALSPERRAAILEGAREELLGRRAEAAARISEEAGKPVGLAQAEVDRAADTLLVSAHAARYPGVEARDLGGFRTGADRLSLSRRVPLGPVLAITPFNFPLNLVAHKLGPAVAAGCPTVLKPASQTPSPALLLGEALLAAGCPAGGLSVLPCRGPALAPLVDDPTFRLLTFTGSAETGLDLRRRSWNRRVTLELGGNAAAVVEPDAGDLDDVARRLALAAYTYAGQSCISVQRVLVHRSVADRLTAALTEATTAFPAGALEDPDTRCGPLIDPANADRVADWIDRAVAAGGRVLAGGARRGNRLAPTLLSDVPPDQPVWAQEVFGPVAVLAVYDNFGQALAQVNDSRFGLQAGIFTRDVDKIRRAWAELEVGAVIQGDVPTWRTDPMPYGGVKDSGVGREGPAAAIRSMTEERLLVLTGGGA